MKHELKVKKIFEGYVVNVKNIVHDIQQLLNLQFIVILYFFNISY
jgi:hypothetical protein